VDVYVNLDRFKPGRDFGVWLRAIVRNRLRMELRRLAQEENRLTKYRQHLLSRMDEADAGEQEAAYLGALQDCRKQLPEKSARLVELRYVHALDFDTIAEQEGSSPVAVQRTLSRVRLLLRDCIKAKLGRV
jgi:RNA polymerase sigma-70 factor (ECF subfamily)